ncbi:MarR family winged helix-turn-helix transcriptional regulator [Micromonospora sp. RHAY321]|uniref:MarR family winged helix-turn-helix transcriptional regulator n=1 Tax=Micromonospora sp. RHAY321 TaxID=2944807 RepID=UPI00207C5959|nr:MarR family winged helix-turn-helix transcriptional regulator [Micromonospora sp. RHAY321]MCO1596939.1 MarR family winged helix-turn-helix transcriptional regulator [Micromonospora sp. RHAY321]
MTGASDARNRPDPLDEDLGWMLGIVFRGYVRAAEHALADFPGGPRGYQVLTAAVNGPTRNQGAIAEELGMDRTVLTYVIDDLERPGLVARRADPADRRSRLVDVTDTGRAAWEQRRRSLRQVESHLLGALSPAESTTLRALLQRVACSAQAVDPLRDLCEVVAQVRPDPTPPGPSPSASAASAPAGRTPTARTRRRG